LEHLQHALCLVFDMSGILIFIISIVSTGIINLFAAYTNPGATFPIVSEIVCASVAICELTLANK